MANTVGARVGTQRQRAGAGIFSSDWLRANGAVLFVYGLTVLLFLVASALSPTFRDPSNLTTIMRQSIVLGLVAIGQTLVILSGGIDMSVGMIAKVTALTVATLFAGNSDMLIPLVLLGLGIGAVI